MKSRILLISTYAELTIMAKKISKELDVPIHIHEGGIMKDGHLYAQKMANNYDVIISVGGTGAAIKDLIHTTPVLSIPITVGDILKALGEAIRFKKPLALISYRSQILYELEELTRLLNNIQYKVFSYSNKNEFTEQVAKAMDLINHTLVGSGNCIQELAHDKNLDYILIKPSYNAIKQTIFAAKNIIDLTSKEKFNTERLNSIIDYSLEGIFSINKSSEITILNPVAEKILGITADSIINRRITDPDIPNIVKTLYDNGTFAINKVVKINDLNYVLNRIPIKINTKYEETIITLQDVSHIQKVEHTTRMQLSAKGFIAKNKLEDIVGISESIKTTIKKAARFSHTSATVLIEGETGTGKELFAQGIHNASPQKNGPFVAINCAALPESLLESELFGYEEGAFTGAKKGGKMGLFELAHNGTIFLDEIGEISPAIQSRLLRILQEKEILRIGGNRILHINVRVIAATNKNLYQLMMDGKFRSDLYFRLNVLNVKIAPLRKRREDLPILIQFFIKTITHKYNLPEKSISPQGIQVLQQYTWPGNIRELETFLEKLLITSDDSVIDSTFITETLQEYTGEQTPHPDTTSPAQIPGPNQLLLDIGTLETMETQIIEKMLHQANGNKQLTAKTLGISRATVWNRLKNANN
jgi:transcriptional regulator with PAS, ATPase and Fis domain